MIVSRARNSTLIGNIFVQTVTPATVRTVAPLLSVSRESVLGLSECDKQKTPVEPGLGKL